MYGSQRRDPCYWEVRNYLVYGWSGKCVGPVYRLGVKLGKREFPLITPQLEKAPTDKYH